MGPPPPSPRIEGQQQHQPYGNPTSNNRNNLLASNASKLRPSSVAAVAPANTAPPLSSYASLASAPPPSFARKTSTTTSTAATTGGDGLASSSATGARPLDSTYHRSSSPRSSTLLGGSSSYSSVASAGRGTSSGGGRYNSQFHSTSSRYDSGAVGGGGGRSSTATRGGPGRGSYRGRFSSISDRFESTRNNSEDRYGGGGGSSSLSLSAVGELSTPRTTGRGGRGGPNNNISSSNNSNNTNDEVGGGGRFYNRRGSTGSAGGSGRFDSASRGRGRGRDYMYGGGTGVGRGGRGRSSFRGGGRGGSYLRGDDSGGGRGGRGSYNGDGAYGNDNSYSSFDNNSVGGGGEPPYHPRSGSFSEDVSLDGQPPPPGGPGELPRFRGGSGSDGGRSVSPHPPPSSFTGGRRPYGSFATENSTDFRRSGSQEGRPDEDIDNTYYTSSLKRRREDSYAAIVAELDEPTKRIARDPVDIQPPPSPAAGSASDVAQAAQKPLSNDPPRSSASSDLADEALPKSSTGDTRLSDEGRWTSPSVGGARDSPHGPPRRQYSGGQFDDAPYLDNYRDSSFRGRGRGRGRSGYRGGGRGGRSVSDYGRSTSSEYGSGSLREYGGRYGSDRRLSITAPSEVVRAATEASPRPFPQYSDLATTSSSNWRRIDSSTSGGPTDDGPQPSPRGIGGDWRKPAPPPAPRVLNSYATLATNPPPRPIPTSALLPGNTATSSSSATGPASPVKTSQQQPPPEPERAQTPPPSPGPPSGLTVALTRLADLEAQMEFAYAKHIMLVKRHKLLEAQYAHLEGLPVGVEAFQDELNQLMGVETTTRSEDVALYGN